MLNKLIVLAIIVANIWAISEVLQFLKGGVERSLWIIAILLLPGFGAALWWYVQHYEPRRRRQIREEKRNAREDKLPGRD